MDGGALDELLAFKRELVTYQRSPSVILKLCIKNYGEIKQGVTDLSWSCGEGSTEEEKERKVNTDVSP